MSGSDAVDKLKKLTEALQEIVTAEDNFWNDDTDSLTCEEAVSYWVLADAQIVLVPLLRPAVALVLERDAHQEMTDKEVEGLIESWLSRALVSDKRRSEDKLDEPEKKADLVVYLLKQYVHQFAEKPKEEQKALRRVLDHLKHEILFYCSDDLIWEWRRT